MKEIRKRAAIGKHRALHVAFVGAGARDDRDRSRSHTAGQTRRLAEHGACSRAARHPGLEIIDPHPSRTPPP